MNKSKLYFQVTLIILVLLHSNSFAETQYQLSLPKPERGFISTKPATSWENGLASGNGRCGALVFGQPQDETIVVSSSDLLMPASRIGHQISTVHLYSPKWS